MSLPLQEPVSLRRLLFGFAESFETMLTKRTSQNVGLRPFVPPPLCFLSSQFSPSSCEQLSHLRNGHFEIIHKDGYLKQETTVGYLKCAWQLRDAHQSLAQHTDFRLTTDSSVNWVLNA